MVIAVSLIELSQQDAFFDVQVTNPKADLHSVAEIQHHLVGHERQNKCQYLQRITIDQDLLPHWYL